MNLTKAGKFSRISNAVAAGQTTVTSSAVDMLGFDAVTAVYAFGSITTGAATSVKAQQSSDDGSADAYSDIEGSSITVLDSYDNKLVLIEINNPQKRYVKFLVSRATQDSVVDGIFAIQTGAKLEPVTQPATVATSEYHLAPDEGTA
jgi:hypothetical protein